MSILVLTSYWLWPTNILVSNMSTPTNKGFHFSSEKRESWFEKFQKRKRDRTQLDHSDWLSLPPVEYKLKWLVFSIRKIFNI